MSALLSLWSYLNDKYTIMLSYGDPRVADWFAMSSPIPSLVICLLYLVFIKVFMYYMNDKPPMDLRFIMQVYNVCMVALSAWLVYEFCISGWLVGYTLGCQPVDYSNSPNGLRMARACWWFYISKFIELLDTFFFVFRKRYNLVTFLHVFHHAVMPASWWFGVKYVPGGLGTFHATLNSFIHFLMYTYYGLAAGGPQFQPYLWWKRYMTSAQMLQFAATIIHTSQLFFTECDYPIVFAWWINFYAVVFLALFFNFYLQTYIKKSRSKKVPEKNGVIANGDIKTE